MALRRFAFLVSSSVFFVSSCAHKPVAQPTGLLPQDFFREQEARLSELKRISAKVGLSFRGVKEKGSGQGRLVAELPDRFRLELRDPLGTLRYLVTLSDETLLAYYPTQKLAYTDKRAGRSYVLRLLGADLSFEELQGVFLGVLPKAFTKAKFDRWDWDAASGNYVAVNEFKQKRIKLFVDPKLATVRQLEVQSDSRGTTTVVYSDFSLCCGSVMRLGKKSAVQLARYVQLRHLSSKSSVEIDWNEIQPLDHPKPAALFEEQLPSDVTLHRLD